MQHNHMQMHPNKKAARMVITSLALNLTFANRNSTLAR